MARIERVEQCCRAMEREFKRHSKGLERGLKKAGVFLLRKSNEYVPVEYGDLKASGFVRSEGAGTGSFVVLIGYTSPYAVYVHEIPPPKATHGSEYNTKHATEIALGLLSARGPNQQYKFLERPAREERPEMRNLIRSEMND